MSLREHLEIMTVQGYHNSLYNLVKIARLKTVSSRKEDLIRALDSYLSNENNIISIFNGLPPYEKELLEDFIRGEGKIDPEDIEEIREKYKLPWRDYYRLGDVLAQKSPARLFFLGRGMPRPIFNVLAKLVRPLKLKFKIVKDSILEKDKDLQIFTIGKSFEKDCINYLKLVNGTKLRTTRGSGLPTKAAMIKVNEVLVNKEPLIGTDGLQDYRVIEETIRLYGLSQLLLNTAILEQNDDGYLEVGWQADDFLRLNNAGKCRMLLQGYLNASDLFELDRIRFAKTRTYRRPQLTEARKTVLKCLRACPINSWVDFGELSHFIKKNERRFLSALVGEIETYNDYERSYSSGNHSWIEVEGSFIEIVLLEYLSTLGIVDLAVVEIRDDYGEKHFLAVNYLRLTPLGAHVLGICEQYEEPAGEMGHSGLIIQPNFEIIVSSGGLKEVHALFLDSFAEIISEGDVNVYKLSFKGVAKALDQGTSIQELIDYFQEFSINPLPENVLITLQEWEKDSRKIRIRTVTIVELEDQYLLEELKSYKTIRQHIRGDLPHVLEINEKSVNRIKREIEKRNHFCQMEKREK